jgi:hypothetical protein
MNQGQRNALLTAAHARMDRAHQHTPMPSTFFTPSVGCHRHVLLLSARYYMRQALGLEGYEQAERC